ncbi:MAG: hypothetical protein KDA60_06685, partial [Planctomycetales bacterium]|nr:hypothetical protein [Planctomycetales bacterium]
IFIDITNPSVDLTSTLTDASGRPVPLFSTGDINVTIPVLSEDAAFITVDGAIAGQPIFGLSKPTISDPIPEFLLLQDSITFSMNPTLLTRKLGLADLIPLEVQRLGVRFNELDSQHSVIRNLSNFDLLVDAQIDFDDPLFDNLPFDPILAVGRPGDGTSEVECDNNGQNTINLSQIFAGSDVEPGVQLPPDAALCRNGFVSAELHLPALLSDNPLMVFKQLGPIYLGFENTPVPLTSPPVYLDGVVHLGEFSNGQFNGVVGGAVRVHDATYNQLDSTVAALGQLTQRREGNTTVTRLDTDWYGEFSGSIASFLSVQDASIRLHTFLENYATDSQPFDLCPTDIVDPSSGESVVTCGVALAGLDVQEVRIELGPWIVITASSSPGDEPIFDVDAGPNEPFIYLRKAEAAFTDAVPEPIRNLGIEAGGFALGRDGSVYLLPDDPSTPGVYDGARVSIRNTAGGSLFGLPDWFPVVISELGVRFDGFADDDGDGQPDTFDVKASEVLENPIGTFKRLADPANFSFLVSGGLQASDSGWPVTGRVKDLVIDVGNIVTFVENGCYQPGNILSIGSEACPFPFTDLGGATIGIDGLSLGPVDVSGQLGLNMHTVVLPDNAGTQTVLYGRVEGEFTYNNMGLGVELILTQYGPVLGRLLAGVPIPIGSLIGSVAGSIVPGLGTAIGGSAGAMSGFILSGFQGTLVFDAPDIQEVENPLDILDNNQFKPANLTDEAVETVIESVISERHRLLVEEQLDCNAFDPSDVNVAELAEQVLRCYTWSKGFRLLGSGVLSNIHLQGQIEGPVVVGANVGFNSSGNPNGPVSAQLFARGDLQVMNQSVATASLVFDFSDPINPSINIAAGIPGTGPGWLQLIVPGQARLGVQVDTDGIAAGALIAGTTFVETIAQGGLTFLDQVLESVAGKLDLRRIEFVQELAARQVELARLLAIGARAEEIQAAVDALDSFRNRNEFFKILLDVNNNWVFFAQDATHPYHDGLLSDTELGYNATTGTFEPVVIDAEFLKDRLLGDVANGIVGLLPDIQSIGSLPQGAFNLAAVTFGKLVEEMMAVVSQGEPFEDNVVTNGTWDPREVFVDWNRNGSWDIGLPDATLPANASAEAQAIYTAIVTAGDASAETFEASARAGLSLLSGAAYTAAEKILEDSLFQARKMTRFGAAMAGVFFDAIGNSIDLFFDTINPSMTVEGFMQPMILGIPFGPPREKISASVTRDSFQLEAKVRLLEKLGMPLPISDTLEVDIQVPFENLYRDLFTYSIPKVDLVGGEDWYVALAGSLDILGLFEVGQLAGFLFPAGAAETLRQKPADQLGITTVSTPVNPNKVFVDNSVVDKSGLTNFDKLQEAGGILVDGRLTLPRFITDPFTLFDEVNAQITAGALSVADGCSDILECVLTHPGETMDFLTTLSDIPGQLSALEEVGKLQIFVPDVLSEIVIDLAAELTGLDPAKATTTELMLGLAQQALEPDDLAQRVLDRLSRAQTEVLHKWNKYGYAQGHYDATLLGVNFGGGEVEVKGDRLELTGDFLGLDASVLIDLNFATEESLAFDYNGNGIFDARESFDEPFVDSAPVNGTWDVGEEFTDWNGDGTWTANGGDLNGDGNFDEGEFFVDANFNGVWDPGDIIADDNGNNQAEPGLPRVGVEIVWGDRPSGCGVSIEDERDLSAVGSDIRNVLQRLGIPSGWLPAATDTAAFGAGACFRGYSPGYGLNESELDQALSQSNQVDIQKTGGIELLATLDLAGLVSGDFEFAITPDANSPIPDFVASADVHELQLPGITVQDAHLSLAKANDALEASLSGSLNFLNLFEFTIPELTGQLPLGGGGGGQGGNSLLELYPTGIVGNFSFGIPSNSPLATGRLGNVDLPFKVSGNTSFHFDTRPSSPGASFIVSGGELSFPFFNVSITDVDVQISYDAGTGQIVVRDLSGHSDLFGVVDLDFDGSFRVSLSPPALIFGAGESIVASANLNMSIGVPAGSISGSTTLTIDNGGAHGTFAGNGTILGVTYPALAGNFDLRGCVRITSPINAVYQMPGSTANCAEAQAASVMIDLQPIEFSRDEGNPSGINDEFDRISLTASMNVLQSQGTGLFEIAVPVNISYLVSSGSGDVVLVSGSSVVQFEYDPGDDNNNVYEDVIELDIILDDDYESDDVFQVSLDTANYTVIRGTVNPFFGNTTTTITLWNDDAPDLSFRNPPSDTLLYYDFDRVQANGTLVFDRNPETNVPTSLDADRFTGDPVQHHSGQSVAVGVPGLTGAFSDGTGLNVGASFAASGQRQSISGGAAAPAYFSFSLDGVDSSMRYKPTDIRFWATTPTGSPLPNWTLSYRLPGGENVVIATSDNASAIADPFDTSWTRYNAHFSLNALNGLCYSEEMTFELSHDSAVGTSWIIDNLTIMGDAFPSGCAPAGQEAIEEAERALELLDLLLPPGFDFGQLPIPGGDELVEITTNPYGPAGDPGAAMIFDYRNTDPRTTDVRFGTPGGIPQPGAAAGEPAVDIDRLIPIVIRTDNGVRSIDLSGLGTARIILDIGGEVSEGITLSNVAEGSQIIVHGAVDDELRLVAGEVGVGSGGRGVDLMFPGRVTQLSSDGWNAGEWHVGYVFDARITNGDFTPTVDIASGFDNFTVFGGNFAPPRFESGTETTDGTGGTIAAIHNASGQGGSVLGEIMVHGDLTRLTANGGNLDATVMAQNVRHVQATVNPDLRVGGNVNGSLQLSHIDRLTSVGGAITTALVTSDPRHDNLRIEARPVQSVGGVIQTNG